MTIPAKDGSVASYFHTEDFLGLYYETVPACGQTNLMDQTENLSVFLLRGSLRTEYYCSSSISMDHS